MVNHEIPISTSQSYELLVIIVTFNSEKDIERCLGSIANELAATRILADFKVCVVDNASSDGTKLILQRLAKIYDWLEVILLDHNIGFGSGNNHAMNAFNANTYFLLNADAWLIGDSLSPALARISTMPNIGVIGLPLVYPDGRPQTYSYRFSSWHRWVLSLLGARQIALKMLSMPMLRKLLVALPYTRSFATIHTMPPLNLSDPKELLESVTLDSSPADWVSGASMLLSREFVKASGGFDPKIFLYGEDEDLCINAHRHGFAVETLKTIPIVHVLGWGKKNFRPAVARMKYTSLRYFIGKNIQNPLNRMLMRMLLPLYVYGRHIFNLVRK